MRQRLGRLAPRSRAGELPRRQVEARPEISGRRRVTLDGGENLAAPPGHQRATFSFEQRPAIDRFGVDRRLVGRRITVARAARVPVVDMGIEHRHVGALDDRPGRFKPNLLEGAVPDVGRAELAAGPARRPFLARRRRRRLIEARAIGRKRSRGVHVARGGQAHEYRNGRDRRCPQAGPKAYADRRARVIEQVAGREEPFA